jgi:hypothetical protein
MHRHVEGERDLLEDADARLTLSGLDERQLARAMLRRFASADCVNPYAVLAILIALP